MLAAIEELRDAARALRNGKGLTLTALATLAVAIGATISIFTVVNAVVLRPLPYPNADRLVMVFDNFAGFDLWEIPTSTGEYEELVEKSQVFEEQGAFASDNAVLTGLEAPLRLSRAVFTASMFRVLGVQPALGRSFEDAEDFAGPLPKDGSDKSFVQAFRGAQVALLSEKVFRTVFGGDPAIVGRTITVNARPITVVGVMPKGFDYPKGTEIWMPLALAPEQLHDFDSRYLRVVGRLKPGVTLEQARADAARVSQLILDEHRYGPVGKWHLTVRTMEDVVVGKSARQSMWVLLAAVAFVLLIACANVATLLMARAVAREREIAVRTALGASRGRIFRQLLVESVLLGVLGGGAGLLLAWWGVDALVAAAPAALPRAEEISWDARVLAVALGLSVGTGLLFGLAPVLQANRVDVHHAMTEGARGTSASRARARKWMVGVQVGLALVLLLGAGLMIRSLRHLLDVDAGFETDRVLTAGVAISARKYPDAAARSAFWQRLSERLQHLPGAEAAGATILLPLQGATDWSFTIEGHTPGPGEPHPDSEWRAVLPGYHRSMGIALVSGRYFDDRDRDLDAPSFIVNEALVRQYFKGADPVGRRMRMGGQDAQGQKRPWGTIVGVVEDTRDWGLDAPARSAFYISMFSFPDTQAMLTVKAKGDPLALVPSLRAELAALDRDVPLFSVKPLAEWVADSIGQRRFATLLLTLFGVLAALLAAIGVYGLMYHQVEQRRHEVGIRMALGADRRTVLGMVLRQALVLVGWGLVGGAAAGLAMSQALKGLLYGVEAIDAVTLAGVTVLLAVVGVLASLIPALLASRVDPMVALRSE